MAAVGATFIVTGYITGRERLTANTAASPSSTGAASATETSTKPARSTIFVGCDAVAVAVTVPAAVFAAVNSTANVSPTRMPEMMNCSSTSSVLVRMVIVPLERPAGIVSLPLGLV